MPVEIGQRLRTEVARRAGHRCEYCLIRDEDAGFAHQVDHIISRKHGGVSALENLAYACVLCNRCKGSDLASVDPISGATVPLFHPRSDRWGNHFRVNGDFIDPISTTGRATARLLRLNSPERRAERRFLQSLGVYPEL